MEDGTYTGDAEARMTDKCRVIYRMMLNTIVPRKGGTNSISWTYKHAIYFLLQSRKINLVDFLFQNMCSAMTTCIKHNQPNIAYPRLQSELFLQSGLVEVLKPIYPSLFREHFSEAVTAKILDPMHINKNFIATETYRERVIRTRLYNNGNNGFPVISQADLLEVQQIFLDDVNKETCANLTLNDVPPAPPLSMPKRGKRKTKLDDEKRSLRRKLVLLVLLLLLNLVNQNL
jgi:hypothetical protein